MMGGLQPAPVSVSVALAAGLLSFLSPCVLPMVPVYLAYLTGTMAGDPAPRRGILVLRVLGFVLGFTLVFVLLGSAASFLGGLLLENRILLSRLGGAAIVFFGLHMVGAFRWGPLLRSREVTGPRTVRGPLGGFFLGMAFAAGWTPCFGPILASILLVAGAAPTMGYGMLLLFFYSLGLGIPFLLSALFLPSLQGWLRRRGALLSGMPRVSGVLLILFGILVFADRVSYLTRLLGG